MTRNLVCRILIAPPYEYAMRVFGRGRWLNARHVDCRLGQPHGNRRACALKDALNNRKSSQTALCPTSHRCFSSPLAPRIDIIDVSALRRALEHRSDGQNGTNKRMRKERLSRVNQFGKRTRHCLVRFSTDTCPFRTRSCCTVVKGNSGSNVGSEWVNSKAERRHLRAMDGSPKGPKQLTAKVSRGE